MIELGLARISQLAKQSPITWKAIHIAGTNGKGSVAAYVSALLHASGLKVGRFTSPHLIDRWDCITVDQKPLSLSAFLEVENEVKQYDAVNAIKATEFELMTATAFRSFSKANIDVGVIECGLGGRLDATNVLKAGDVLCSAITSIGLDHQTLLGNSLAEIAREKAGIIKPGVPVVADGSNESEALDVIDNRVREVGAKLILTGFGQKSQDQDPLHHDIAHVERHLGLAAHQKNNLEVALYAFQAAKAASPHLDWNPTRLDNRDLVTILGPAHKSWKGRLQTDFITTLTGRSEAVLLDGAHNIQAAKALEAYVSKLLRVDDQPITWMVAMSQGKDIASILSVLVKAGDKLVATKFGPVDGMPWVESVNPEELIAAASSILTLEGGNTVTSEENVWGALRRVSEVADGGPLVITGSLYLVSDVLRLMRDSSSNEGRDEPR